MNNPVVQWQMVSTEPEAIGRFYSGLFGWKISTANSMGYRQVKTGDEGFSGGIWPAPPQSHSFVQLFVGVNDVQRTVDKAIGMGAKVIVPVTVLPDGDTMAVLADPAGVTFGVMKLSD